MGDEIDNNNEASRRGVVFALLAVALLGIAGDFRAHELSAGARLQDCVLSGRSNCALIESTR